MKRFCNGWLTRLILLGLACLGPVAACQRKAPESAQIPIVTLIADGQERYFQTSVATVGELLTEAGVVLGDLDQVEPAPYTSISDGLTITVVRVRHETVTEERLIPFDEQTAYDASLPPDERRILEAGQNGLEQLVYRVVYHDGLQVERVQVRRVTLQEPHPRQVLVGARDTISPVPITGTVAYLAGNTDVGYNAWLMRGSSGSQRRLTFDGSLDTRVLALSPGGAYLLFTRNTSETLDNSSQLNSLWLLDTTLADAEAVDLGLANVLWADWSPDGQTIAYSSGKATLSAPGWEANNDLWTAELNRRQHLVNRRKVVESGAGGAYGWWGANYAWSPNRRFIAYAQADSIGIIRLHDGRRTELRRFAPFLTYSHWVWVPQPSWSPDSRFLTAVVHGPSVTGEPPEQSQLFDVWVLDVERPLAVKQVSEAGMWAAPAWSPVLEGATDERRSSQIVFGRAKSPYESGNSAYDLYVMDRDGSNRWRIFPAEDQVGPKTPQVTWGPTGQQLITVHQNDLFLIDLAQNATRRLTLDGNVLSAVWVP
ncbi:MAG: G5 domain-containing protein [Anaerolineae bacterium]